MHMYVRPVLEIPTRVRSRFHMGTINRIEPVQRYFTTRFKGLHDFSYAESLE